MKYLVQKEFASALYGNSLKLNIGVKEICIETENHKTAFRTYLDNQYYLNFNIYFFFVY